MSFGYKKPTEMLFDEIKEMVNKMQVTPEQAIRMLELVEKRKNNSLLEQQNKYMKIYIKDRIGSASWMLLD